MAAPLPALVNVEIIVGTYEEFLVGYRLFQRGQKYDLTQSFANHAHSGSVRCLTCKGKFVASGGVDETIRLFNMKTRSEVGSLQQHNGTVNTLQFCGDSHLASCSDDGTVCIWNIHSWQCLKTLRGHKGEVNSVSVHPSGKLALSVSKDKTLRTWNLVKGRSAYITNIKEVAESVHCSPDGQHFAVVVKNRVDIYTLETAGVIHSIDFGKHVICVNFLQDNILAIGGEGDDVEIHDIIKETVIHVFKAHSKRIKALFSVQPPDGPGGLTWLVSASSDGFIKIWQLDLHKLELPPELVAQVDTKCRITCMVVSKFQTNQEGEEEDEQITDQNHNAASSGFQKHKSEEESKEKHVPVKKRKKSKTP